MWRWDGFTAAADAPSAAARRLAERNRLGDLQKEAAQARAAADALRLEAEAAQQAVRAAAQDETQEYETAQMMRRGLDGIRQRLAEAERQQGEVAAKRSALVEAQTRLAGERQDVAERRDALAEQVSGMADAAALEAALERARQKASADRQAANEARVVVQSLQREAEMRGRRLAAIAADKAAWDERRNRAQGQIAEIERRRDEVEEEREALREAPDLFAARRRAILTEIAAAETARGRPRTGWPAQRRRCRPPTRSPARR